VEVRDAETYAVIGAAMEVHRELGCGLLECPYKDALELELGAKGIPFVREFQIPVFYKGQRLRSFYVADFVCFDRLVLEVKAVKAITDVDRAQTINYLKATRYERALLLNFGVLSLQYERIVNHFARPG
jgi:GxxExxY protein